jgi:hypothetical protein
MWHGTHGGGGSDYEVRARAGVHTFFRWLGLPVCPPPPGQARPPSDPPMLNTSSGQNKDIAHHSAHISTMHPLS